MSRQGDVTPPTAGRSDDAARPDRVGSAPAPRSGEPPVLLDPRRWGALLGIAGAFVFVFSYTPPLGADTAVPARVLGGCLAAVALVHLYLRPSSLGAFREPSRTALLVYGGCVAGELVAIAAGSRWLTSLGQADLRPALIAAVVGVHFLPFAWAFGEPMFYRLGSVLVVLGVAGLVVGWAGLGLAAPAAAVLSGLSMLALVILYSRGHFVARARQGRPSRSR